MPVIMDLRNPNLKTRHWLEINEIVGQEIVHDETFTLKLLEDIGAFGQPEKLQEVGGSASSEAALDAMLSKLEVAWKDIELPILAYRDSKDVFILGGLDEVQVLLDDSMVTISTIAGSRYCAPIKNRVDDMEHSLKLFGETLEEWIECQKAWMYLESIFSAPDIQRQLPAEAKMFLEVDKSFKDAMRKTYAFPNALRAGCTPGFLGMFKKNNELLDTIQKCLEDYLASKRAVFSRFYFLSNDELLEILSQTRNPLAVQPHMRKCFDMIQKLEFGEVKTDDGEVKHTNDIYAMIDPKGERVGLGKGLKARGNVEVWLGNVEAAMRTSLKQCAKDSIEDYPAQPREKWAGRHCSQIVIMVGQIYWSRRMVECLTSSNPVAALKKFEVECKQNLATLAELARGKLGDIARRILGALITIDVHARDIVTALIESECDSITKFEWTKQLRYAWNEEEDTCVVEMSNAVIYYSYEYLGADMRLVVTPLTDKCYLCLLGAVQLDLGGAPAGPAGTGKTETTKDLAKAIGIQCVVFNCSEQMDFKMTGRFFSGLAQSGAWCCFDEFNRINIEVLSVIAQQVLTIRHAKIAGQDRFQFEGREIGLIRTCAVFITMNPGFVTNSRLHRVPQSPRSPILLPSVFLYLLTQGYWSPTYTPRARADMLDEQSCLTTSRRSSARCR
jgi:dynein heavy chain